MKYFIDTEFHEDGRTIDLISLALALVAEDGRELYMVNLECDFDRIWTLDSCAWLRENVMPHIDISLGVTRDEIRRKVLDFVQLPDPEFYGYYADYDWVVFCQLFGRMIDLPKGFPMFCRDIKQMVCELGNIRLPKTTNEHNALDDARWVRNSYDKLWSLTSERAFRRELATFDLAQAIAKYPDLERPFNGDNNPVARYLSEAVGRRVVTSYGLANIMMVCSLPLPSHVVEYLQSQIGA